MSLSLDDKLLGEKVHYYCSSSEDEGSENGLDDEDSPSQSRSIREAGIPSPGEQPTESFGAATNTGPKGVIKDWREYKRLETEKRLEQDKQRAQLAKKLTLTCRSHLNDEQERNEDEQFLADLDDEFLKEYREKRIEEMRRALAEVPKFGKLISLTSQSFIDQVDGENAGVTVVVHIYHPTVEACESMNGCLICLAAEYPTIKFCKISASESRMSFKFAVEGVPALLVYKNKELVGNFIRLRDEFGEDFFAHDVEGFLQEHGFLPSQESDLMSNNCEQASRIRGPAQRADDSDSDFDVD